MQLQQKSGTVVLSDNVQLDYSIPIIFAEILREMRREIRIKDAARARMQPYHQKKLREEKLKDIIKPLIKISGSNGAQIAICGAFVAMAFASGVGGIACTVAVGTGAVVAVGTTVKDVHKINTVKELAKELYVYNSFREA